MNMPPKPKITVAIPTKNRPEMLTQSLKSVMEQDFKDRKIVVIDNASRFLVYFCNGFRQ